jgi:hypothetical protein
VELLCVPSCDADFAAIGELSPDCALLRAAFADGREAVVWRGGEVEISTSLA